MTEHTRLRPLTIRGRLLGRIDSSSDESGFVLVFVLILAVALITMLTFAVSSSVGNLGNAANYGNQAQAQLTAQSGLSTATAAMAGQSIATLPCLITNGQMPLPQTANGTPTYSVTIAYYSTPAPTGTALQCNGSGNATLGTGGTPQSAIVTSTGTILTASGSSLKSLTPVVMTETLSITATGGQLLPGFAPALFSSSVNLTSDVEVNQIAGQPTPTVYGGSVSECTDGTIIEGSVYSYSSVNLNSNCTIYGNLYVAGNVAISNTVLIKGSVYAYGGSVSLTSTPTIDGSIYAVDGSSGTINANTNAVTVDGNLEATGSIINTSKATIGGSIVPNDAAIASWVMQPQVAFPQLNPTVASLQAAGYTVYQVGDTLLGQVSCALFFVPSTLLSLINSLLLGQPTAIYAPTCSPKMTGLGILTPYIISANMIWVLGGFEADGTTDFVPPLLSPASPDLSIIVPYGTSCSKKNGNIVFTNDTIISSRINVLLYTPCTADFTVDPSMSGQILASTEISATNNFILNFNNLAALSVPGTTYPASPAANVESKAVISG